MADFESDYPDDDVVVLRNDIGQAAVLPVSLRRMSGDLLGQIGGLQKVTGDMLYAAEQQTERVLALRDQGVPWSAIGWAVGTTGEAARQRWGTPSS